MTLAKVWVPEVHEDERGRLIELSRPGERHGQQVFLTTALPGRIKGNHYHERKTEWFFVLAGQMTLCLRDVDTGESEDLELDAGSGSLVEVGPGIVHTLRNDGDSELIVLVFVDEVFDPLDPDTHPFPVFAQEVP